jgi:type IV pilus assembly protein PilM
MAFSLELFQPKFPSLLGLDIGSSSVKLVELSDSGKGTYKLERYTVEALPKDATADGNIANLDAVADTIKRAWRRLGSGNKRVAMALPSSMVITKKIVVPKGQRDEDLEMQVEAEANQYIPFALDEVNLDFQVLGPAQSASPDDVEVLIAASRKEKVEDRVAAAEAAGLKPLVMDVDSYATQSAIELVAAQMPAGGRDQNLAVFDVGAHVMHCYVLRNGQTLFMRDQAIGGNQLTHDIQRSFNLSAEEAETAKRSGGLPDTYDSDVLQPFMETLALEVTRALQFFFTSTSFSAVDHIVLAGGCAMLPGLDELIGKRTGVNTLVANPFANMVQADRIKPRQLSTDAPSLVVACGLALRSFDR